MGYDQLTNMTCVDNLNLDFYHQKKRFTLVYVLNKINTASRIVVLVDLPEDQTVESITSVYPSANWLEREIFDLFGLCSFIIMIYVEF